MIESRHNFKWVKITGSYLIKIYVNVANWMLISRILKKYMEAKTFIYVIST